MPTPSSNTPPGPSPPRSHSFSTCPDDIQSPFQSAWGFHDAVQNTTDAVAQRSLSSTVDDAVSARDGTVNVDTAVYDSPAQDTSSRSSTTSPHPPAVSTDDASFVAHGSQVDLAKSHEAEIGSQLSRESSTGTIQALDTDTMPCANGRARISPARDLDLLNANEQQNEFWSPSMGPDYSSMRFIPSSPSSYLRSGSRFHGTQQSERQVYDVQVEIKHVDMHESFLCGYLRIQGLTEDHPTLTTYFEGEIIGTKYSFFTQHDNWGANNKVDMSHWAKFNAFRPYQKQARKGRVTIKDFAQRENIFMRWKEHFLVPDHRVRTITGASFEGFYYICFNQVKGEVSGIYFHSKSEKFQQLELKHVPDRGCFASVEFR